MRTRSWASIRQHPYCVACGDAGAFIALLRSRPGDEYTFRCFCTAGHGHPARGIPQWADADEQRYRRVSAHEMTHPGLAWLKARLGAANGGPVRQADCGLGAWFGDG